MRVLIVAAVLAALGGPAWSQAVDYANRSGTITTGGKIVETRKDGKVVSRAIEGGDSRRVSRGDFVMIPEGVPHYVTEASPELIFMAIEFPRPRAAQMPPAPTN